MGEVEKALAAYTVALELNPELAQVYFCRGLVYHSTGEYDKALADLERYLELGTAPPQRNVATQLIREIRGE